MFARQLLNKTTSSATRRVEHERTVHQSAASANVKAMAKAVAKAVAKATFYYFFCLFILAFPFGLFILAGSFWLMESPINLKGLNFKPVRLCPASSFWLVLFG